MIAVVTIDLIFELLDNDPMSEMVNIFYSEESANIAKGLFDHCKKLPFGEHLTKIVVYKQVGENMFTLDELTKIANSNGLNLYQTQRFIEFAKLWKNGRENDESYLSEWASRFRKQCDYVMADDETRTLLAKVDGKIAPYVLASQYRRLEWSDESIYREVSRLEDMMV